MSLTRQANVKLNLGLRITGRRPDGYHLLHTVFQEVSWGDRISLTPNDRGKITLTVDGPCTQGVPGGASNLVVKTAQLLKNHTGHDGGVKIALTKHVPSGSGLGGGSSDAAAVLMGLNELWALNLSHDELVPLAMELGADVPFFLTGGRQLGEGIGEKLTPLPVQRHYEVVLVIPDLYISTPWAFKQLAKDHQFRDGPDLGAMIAQTEVPWNLFANDFEAAVFPRHPQLVQIKQRLTESGAVYASLSGSGSTLFGLYEGDIPGNLAEIFRSSTVVHCRTLG